MHCSCPPKAYHTRLFESLLAIIITTPLYNKLYLRSLNVLDARLVLLFTGKFLDVAGLNEGHIKMWGFVIRRGWRVINGHEQWGHL